MGKTTQDRETLRNLVSDLRKRLRKYIQAHEDAPVVFVVKGPGGLSKELIATTRKNAEMMRLTAINQHPTTEEQERAAEQLSVVPARLVEVSDA